MSKTKNYAWITFALIMVGYFIYQVSKRYRTDHISKSNIEHTKAVIISDKNYNGNSRVKLDYTYSYTFSVKGERYKGDSHDHTLKIGDTVEIQYDKGNPSLNKPAHPKE
jgi:hypothetical protein